MFSIDSIANAIGACSKWIRRRFLEISSYFNLCAKCVLVFFSVIRFKHSLSSYHTLWCDVCQVSNVTSQDLISFKRGKYCSSAIWFDSFGVVVCVLIQDKGYFIVLVDQTAEWHRSYAAHALRCNGTIVVCGAGADDCGCHSNFRSAVDFPSHIRDLSQ